MHLSGQSRRTQVEPKRIGVWRNPEENVSGFRIRGAFSGTGLVNACNVIGHIRRGPKPPSASDHVFHLVSAERRPNDKSAESTDTVAHVIDPMLNFFSCYFVGEWGEDLAKFVGIDGIPETRGTRETPIRTTENKGTNCSLSGLLGARPLGRGMRMRPGLFSNEWGVDYRAT